MTVSQTPIINTQLILSGLGLADRKTLADLLAFLRDENAWKQVADLFIHWSNKASSMITKEEKDEINRLKDRLTATADDIVKSDTTDNALRLLLWMLLRDAYNLPAEITLSHRGAESISQDVGARMTETFFSNADSIWLSPLPDGLRDLLRIPAKRGTFSNMVEDYAIAQVNALLDESTLRTDAEREALFDEIWQAVSSSTKAIELGEVYGVGKEALIKALSTSGTVTSLAVAVEAAGFSAYILAAQASAIIPLVGGKTMVSLLAVAVNPVVVVPAVILGARWAKKSSDQNLMTAFGSIAGSTLTMIGLREPREGINVMLEVFQNGEKHLNDLRKQGGSVRRVINEYQNKYSQLTGALASKGKQNLYDKFDKPLGAEATTNRLSMRFLESILREDREAAVLTALTIGDLVYYASMVDPKAVDAADFSSADSINGVFDFALFSEKLRARSGRSLNGSEERLKGYVAEETVAHRLIENGHVVERPESASQPGYDLIVDGQPVQVKCHDDLSGLKDHFEQYPDIPVIANAELQPKLSESDAAWADQVYFVEGFSDKYVTEVTQESLSAGEELLDFDVPIFSVSLAAARNLLGWWKGQVAPEELVWTTTTDVAGKGALSIIGSFTGASVGLLLLGPAGAVIGGPAGGIFGAGSFSKMKLSLGCRIEPETEKLFNSAVSTLARKCIQVLDEKVDLICKKQSILGAGPASSYARQRLDDDIQYIMERKCDIQRFVVDTKLSVRERRDGILTATIKSTVHPSRIQNELRALHEAYNELDKALAKSVRDTTDETMNVIKRTGSDAVSSLWNKIQNR